MTATSELHELAVKKGVRAEFKFLEPFNFEFKHQMGMWSKDEMRGNYRVQLNVAGYEFFGQADLPQTAKHNAASQVSSWCLKEISFLMIFSRNPGNGSCESLARSQWGCPSGQPTPARSS